MSAVTHVSPLPPELTQAVFSFLDARSLCRAAVVCRLWRVLASADCLWAHLFTQLLGVGGDIPALSWKEKYIRALQAQKLIFSGARLPFTDTLYGSTRNTTRRELSYVGPNHYICFNNDFGQPPKVDVCSFNDASGKFESLGTIQGNCRYDASLQHIVVLTRTNGLYVREIGGSQEFSLIPLKEPIFPADVSYYDFLSTLLKVQDGIILCNFGANLHVINYKSNTHKNITLGNWTCQDVLLWDQDSLIAGLGPNVHVYNQAESDADSIQLLKLSTAEMKPIALQTSTQGLFKLDDQKLISANARGVVTLWDIKSRKRIASVNTGAILWRNNSRSPIKFEKLSANHIALEGQFPTVQPILTVNRPIILNIKRGEVKVGATFWDEMKETGCRSPWGETLICLKANKIFAFIHGSNLVAVQNRRHPSGTADSLFIRTFDYSPVAQSKATARSSEASSLSTLVTKITSIFRSLLQNLGGWLFSAE